MNSKLFLTVGFAAAIVIFLQLMKWVSLVSWDYSSKDCCCKKDHTVITGLPASEAALPNFHSRHRGEDRSFIKIDTIAVQAEPKPPPEKALKDEHPEYYRPYTYFLANLRHRKNLSLLEFGVGGYSRGNYGGVSLSQWCRFFPNPSSRIQAVDLYPKREVYDNLEPSCRRRVQIHQCSQTDFDCLEQQIFRPQFSRQNPPEKRGIRKGAFDLIVDDASHHYPTTHQTFEFAFPYLSNGGWYVVEDTQTSYFPSPDRTDILAFNGSCQLDGLPSSSAPTFSQAEATASGHQRRGSTMGYFKRLADDVNFREVQIPLPNFRPHPFAHRIRLLVFAHNLVLIQKGDNSEASILKEGIFRQFDDVRAACTEENRMLNTAGEADEPVE